MLRRFDELKRNLDEILSHIDDDAPFKIRMMLLAIFNYRNEMIDAIIDISRSSDTPVMISDLICEIHDDAKYQINYIAEKCKDAGIILEYLADHGHGNFEVLVDK